MKCKGDDIKEENKYYIDNLKRSITTKMLCMSEYITRLWD